MKRKQREAPRSDQASKPLVKERGVWVWRTGKPLPANATEKTLRQVREVRDRSNRGDDD